MNTSTVFRNLEAGRPQTVLLYGTSLTEGGAWTQALREWFDTQYPGQVTFLNRACGGMNSDWGAENLQTRVLDCHPDLVFLEFSYNDAHDKFALPVERGAANLDRMVKAIRAQSPETLIVLQIMNIGWDAPNGNRSASVRPRLQAYNDNYRRYAASHGLPLLDHNPAWRRILETEPERFQRMIPDGSHPTPEASLSVTWPAIRDLLESLRQAARTAPRRPKAVFVMYEGGDAVYGPRQRQAIEAMAEVSGPFLTPENWRQHPEITCDAEWIFASWGMPPVDEELLKAFPKLRAIFYAAGTVKGFVTDALWERGIVVTSAFAANAIPVAEFTVAQIVLSLKAAWRAAAKFREVKKIPSPAIRSAGAYGSTVGLISLGMIGRLVAERLRSFDVDVIAYDPFVSPEKARELGVRLCTLEEVFTQSDVVSCHAPWLKETEGMLRREHFLSMKPDATFINTSRGAVVNEAEMIEVLAQRPDLFALIDVTWPEPPVPDSPLYTLPNVFMTPHIAGSRDNECWRMAQYMVDEASRLLAGEPLRYAITPEKLKRMA
ncbi:MAG: NAD(P)-dependent oxidoreductase [Chthoniobacteraceae bacterium]|nr:NAD(P)-dependent oxidoreductase [Chthoniobacteraceae bacterium]